MRTVGSISLFALFSAFAASGCAADAGPSPETTSTDPSALYVQNTTWSTPYIVVCWENPGWSTEKTWVREAVENTWMKETRVVFAGWGACSAGTQGIHITLENGMRPAGNNNARYGWPRSGVGHDGNDNVGMTLTFDYLFQASSFGGCQADPGREQCIRKVAVHEFGHALGFQHEQDSPKATSDCVNRIDDLGNKVGIGDGDPGAYEPGPFDRNSIMSYCSDDWNNGGKLSPGDVFYAQSVYGRKTAGDLVSFDGRCLDVAGGNANGAAMQTYECLGGTQFARRNVNGIDVAAPNQRFWTSVASGAIGLYDTGRVVDVPRNDASDGNRLQFFDVLNTPGQSWHFDSVRLRSLGGMCVAPYGNATANMTPLTLVSCDPTVHDPNLSFSFQPNGSIRHEASGRCLDVRAFGRSNGTAVQLWDCNGLPNQTWTMTEDGSLSAYGSPGGLCMDSGLKDTSRFYGTDNTYFLQVWGCNRNPQQTFSVAGPVVGLAGKCMDVRAFGRANGTPVQLWDCNGLANQSWEFHW